MKNLTHETLDAVICEMARQQGHELNGQDWLLLRTRIAASLAAKERYRQRMSTDEFQWKKPAPPKR